MMQPVSKINVVNKGGYVFNYSVQWLDSNGEWHTSDWNSGNYSVGFSRETPELGSIGVTEDALAVTVYGHAVLGTGHQRQPTLSPGRTATGCGPRSAHIRADSTMSQAIVVWSAQ